MSEDFTERIPALWANIPAAVLFDKDLKPSAKLIYGVISSMAISRGYCYASNKYIGELFGLEPKSVSKIISELAERNYIFVELIKAENGTIESRRIWIDGCRLGFENPPQKNGGGIPQKKDTPPQNKGEGILQKAEEIDTSNINNTPIVPIKKIAPKAVMDMFTEYASGDAKLFEALLGFAEMRAKIRSPITTERTAKLLIKKLNTLSGGSVRAKIDMLDEATVKNWKTIYAPKDGGATVTISESEGLQEWT